MGRLELERWRDHAPGLMGIRSACAVLVPVVCAPGEEPALLFEVRARSLRRQPGEVCFPGGRMEEGETPIQCALRETGEELGIPPSAIEVIGPLDRMPMWSGVLMHPILARVHGREPWSRIEPAEVEEVFLVPVSFFERETPRVWRCPLVPRVPEGFPHEELGIPRDYPWRGGWHEIAVYRYGDRIIWGLTARIVRHLFGD